MIIPFLTFLVGGGIGFAAGHATSNKEAKAELEELRRRLQIAQGNGTPIPALRARSTKSKNLRLSKKS